MALTLFSCLHFNFIAFISTKKRYWFFIQSLLLVPNFYFFVIGTLSSITFTFSTFIFSFFFTACSFCVKRIFFDLNSFFFVLPYETRIPQILILNSIQGILNPPYTLSSNKKNTHLSFSNIFISFIFKKMVDLL